MSTSPGVGVPRAPAASYARGFGEEGREWIARLPALAAELLER
jgi:streptomycin 6-kinase